MVLLCGLCRQELPEFCRTAEKTGQTYPGFCNQYCFLAFGMGIREKVPLTNYVDQPKMNGHMIWPYINISCGWCTENKIELKHKRTTSANRVFCSRSCYSDLCNTGGRRAFARFIILRHLSLHPNKQFTALQIQKFLKPYGTTTGGSLSSGSIGSMLKVYVARGTIKAIGDSWSTKEYQIASSVVNSPTPIGKYV